MLWKQTVSVSQSTRSFQGGKERKWDSSCLILIWTVEKGHTCRQEGMCVISFNLHQKQCLFGPWILLCAISTNGFLSAVIQLMSDLVHKIKNIALFWWILSWVMSRSCFARNVVKVSSFLPSHSFGNLLCSELTKMLLFEKGECVQLFLRSLNEYFLSLPSRDLQLASCNQEGSGMAACSSSGAAEFPSNPQRRNYAGG